MTILIIIAMGILLLGFIFNLNSRINTLENKFKNIRIVNHTSTTVNNNVPNERIETIQKVEEKVTPVNHQDHFAKNLAKFGVTVLALGVLFFLKYLDNKGFISYEIKYIAGLLFGVILLGIAEYIKNKNKQYTNILRGGAFVVLYLTIFLGFTLFNLTSWFITLSLITITLISSIIISYRDNDSISFTLGSLGAYLTLLFTAVNHNISKALDVNILSYLLVLNLAIIFISFKKDWLKDSIIGFIATWSIFVSLFSSDISKSNLFLFSSLFGLQYLIIFLMQDFKNNKNSKVTVFFTSLNSLIYLSFIYSIMFNTKLFDYIGYLLVILGVFHIIIFILLNRINKDVNNNLIKLTHFVVGILIITAAVPLQFDGPIVTMIWFLEGVVLAFLAITKSFKDKYLMYVLSFIAIIIGIIHMIHMVTFGVYNNVFNTGRMFINQNYIIWFTVFVLINLIKYRF